MKMLFLSLAALLLASPSYASEPVTIRTISVSGLAERLVVPDEAHIGVNINTLDAKLAAAKSSHDAKLSRLLAITKAAGIEDKKIATSTSIIEPIYTYKPIPATGQSSRVFNGYRVQTNLDITVVDTKKIGELMDKISKAGLEVGASTEWGNLLNLYYTFSRPDEIRDALLIDAIRNAKAKAEKMAAATGARIARVYQINEGNVPQFQPIVGYASLAKSASFSETATVADSPPAGEQKLQTTVTVIYELE